MVQGSLIITGRNSFISAQLLWSGHTMTRQANPALGPNHQYTIYYLKKPIKCTRPEPSREKGEGERTKGTKQPPATYVLPEDDAHLKGDDAERRR
jgi:hypothetical protein